MTFRLAAVCLTFVICWCYSQSLLAQNSSPSPTPTPSLEQRVSDLEKKLQAIESIPGVALMLNLRNSAQANATPQPTPTAQADAPLELIRWSYQFKRGQYEYENRHLFTYILKNRTDKTIKLVEGSILFTDLLGEKLISIRLFQDLKYPGDEANPMSGEWNVNQFEPGEQRMATIDHDDVKATLIIQKVVFSDNTVWSGDKSQQ
jgi:hypothetical protein